MEDADILEAVADSPNAYQLVAQMQTLLEREKENRRQFLDLIHENVKAEFINGEVIMHSPVKREHLRASTNLSFSITGHVKQHALGELFIEKAMVHLFRNNYEPDICFFSKEKAAQFYPGQLLFPAPDFVVEIVSTSTEKIDRSIKMQDYAAHGVVEYWIIDPVKQSVEQYLPEKDRYHLQTELKKEGTIYAKAVVGYQVKLEDIF